MSVRVVDALGSPLVWYSDVVVSDMIVEYVEVLAVVYFSTDDVSKTDVITFELRSEVDVGVVV